MQIIKRDGTVATFNKDKIYIAILKAMRNGSGEHDKAVALEVSCEIEKDFKASGVQPTIALVECTIFNMLIDKGFEKTARAFEGYRAIQAFKRAENTTDEGILGLVNYTNADVMEENSNKNAVIASTQRDLIAGEVSKDITRRKKLPAYIVQAHDDGILHFHDMDYFLQPIFNCCLINMRDMLDNGTVINKRMIDSPRTFRVACTVMTQIIAQVASSQYGGQSVDIGCLGKYLARSRDYYYNMFKDAGIEGEALETAARAALKNELQAGVQTIQYQINTLMTTNGQSPFVTLFLNIDTQDAYADETAQIIEEILKQRLQGIKNEQGVYTTPAFPKLVYVLHEHNTFKGGGFDYVTKVAAQCSAKRLYPDYISAKRMKEIYEGNVFSPMGCRSFLSPWKDKNGEYKFEGRFNQGVVSLNLPQIAIISQGDVEKFNELLGTRLDLCFDALMCRHNNLLGTVSDVSPIHWQHGAIARLQPGDVIDPLLKGGYSTLSLGYIGLYEAVKLLIGVSHTSSEGAELAKEILNTLRKATDLWKKTTGLGFGLYGSPAESLCYRFARIDLAKYGSIEDVTDKGYYTNSYHTDVREEIDAFTKLEFEAQFQPISSGGCISYVEIPNMNHNPVALEQMISFFYEGIQYAEFNTKSDYCHVCGFDGEIQIVDETHWECPVCQNRDQRKMNVIRRTCGYLGDNYWNKGKTKEISKRVLHL